MTSSLQAPVRLELPTAGPPRPSPSQHRASQSLDNRASELCGFIPVCPAPEALVAKGGKPGTGPAVLPSWYCRVDSRAGLWDSRDLQVGGLTLAPEKLGRHHSGPLLGSPGCCRRDGEPRVLPAALQEVPRS